MKLYDLCVIGSGSGNSLLDERFQGWSVALVDEGVNAELGEAVFGGTCLNVGCIPTKMFVLPADLAASPADAARLGVDLALKGVRFEEIRDRIFGRIDAISSGGLAWREQLPWVDVYRQRARFVDEHTLELADGTRLRAKQFVLAARFASSRARCRGGGRGCRRRAAAHLQHRDEGAASAAAHDHPGRRFRGRRVRPRLLGLRVDVTLVHRGPRLLRLADELISERFTAALGERVKLELDQQVVGLETSSDGASVTVVTAGLDGVQRRHEADLVLNATGRVSNADTLNLGTAGVEVDASGYVVADAHQRTTQPHIWALGDISSHWQLKHVANHEMRVVQHNLSHPDDLVESDHRFVPCAVFSDPQIGQVGRTEAQLRADGIDHVVAVQEYRDVAFGWALEDQVHVVKLLGDPHTRQLLGAHVMGPQAATLVQLCVQAMSFGTDIDSMARGQYWIHPALTEVIENALLGLVAQMPEPGTR